MVQGLLTTASKTDGEYRYNFATVPFLAECLKLLISCWLLRKQATENPEVNIFPTASSRVNMAVFNLASSLKPSPNLTNSKVYIQEV